MKKCSIFLGLLAFLFLLTQSLFAEKIRVVSTFSILGDLVEHVGGEAIDLKTLLGPGCDIHQYAPSPQDAVSIAEADIIFENGLGLEFWLDALYKASGSKAIRIELSRGLPVLKAGQDFVVNQVLSGSNQPKPCCCKNKIKTDSSDICSKGNISGETSQPIEECTGKVESRTHLYGGALDPHVWLDVKNVMSMVVSIADTLMDRDSKNADLYDKNASIYLAQLEELDTWIVDQVQSIPSQHRQLITDHDNLRYFSNRYGFKVLGNVMDAFSSSTQEPSAGHIVDIIKIIKKNDIPVIFGDIFNNMVVLDRVVHEAKIRPPQLLYIDALGNKNSPASTYEAMMRYNVNKMTQALQ